MDNLNEILETIAPSLCDPRILYWSEFIKNPPKRPLVLYGAGAGGSAIAAHLQSRGISPALFIDISPQTKTLLGVPVVTPGEAATAAPRDAFVVVTIADYAKNPAIYADIRNAVTTAAGLDAPYYIHEWSSGFPLGAKKIPESKEKILRAFALLSDDESRDVFTKFIRAATKNYFLQMGHSLETLGGGPELEEISGSGNFASIPPDEYLIYCSSSDWDGGDPDLRLCLEAKGTVFLYPIQIYRLKLREYLYSLGNGAVTKSAVLDSLLTNRDGYTEIQKAQFMGGTPLKPEYTPLPCHGITLDSLARDLLSGEEIGMIKLDMGMDFKKAIEGAAQIISTQHPIIAVNGFQYVNWLWEAVLTLHEMLPGYTFTLKRYLHENMIKGYVVRAIPR